MAKGLLLRKLVFTSEKSYAFVVNTKGSHDKSYICKVKGVSLNYNTAKYINFEKMKHLVLTPEYATENAIRLNTNVILRTGDSTVYSTEKEYTFKVNASKRRRIGVEKICTLPYGYQSRICLN